MSGRIGAAPDRSLHVPLDMLVFLDFEASSLSKQSYPIEVGWVFEDGTSEAHLIRPAPDWTDWDPAAEAIHHIPRIELEREGTPHDAVAQRMIEVLSGHDLLASAPSWDGKWLSTLLRAAGLPRHSLRLRDSDAALRETARAGLRGRVAEDRLEEEAANLVALCEVREAGVAPAHRALADAQEERARWLAVRAAAKG
ncbi:transcriptional regulator [Sphingomonas sp. IC-56]|uniref:3'-5' exonuclease n=1 Tax=Sphingomonas sp. IC-56 TaxID=2898529 RepID=UPI001E5EC678|nr:transcriptional regulator [Sphingomonas sp. IC-56]MCD2323403.1 transcriptional regulator [Sphingomonas sp. IC-56]